VVHDVAAQGFSDPGDYERARPSYPPEAVAWFVDQLGIAPGKTVIDLASGTGKFTRLLAPAGADLVACEPVAGMRTTFRSVLVDTPLIAGTSEAVPLRDASVDAVTVAQAWHWFDHDRAAAEMARIIRPGGGLGLVWTARDRSVPWVDAVWSIMDRVEKRAPWRDHENWRDSGTEQLAGFAPFTTAEFRHAQTLTPEGVVQRIASVSHVAVLPESEREAVLAEVRDLLHNHPDARNQAELQLVYRADCLVALRS
jgi:SAM-dependent methyltransferase